MLDDLGGNGCAGNRWLTTKWAWRGSELEVIRRAEALGPRIIKIIVYGTEADGKVIAWRRNDGDRAWVSERYLRRSLTAPVVVGKALAFGENNGTLHFLAKEDGAVMIVRVEMDLQQVQRRL